MTQARASASSGRTRRFGIQPEGTHQPRQFVRLALHRLRGGRRFLHQRRVLLRHPVHLRDRYVHLFRGGGERAGAAAYPADPDSIDAPMQPSTAVVSGRLRWN